MSDSARAAIALAADGDEVPDGVEPPAAQDLADAEQLFKDLDDDRR